MKEIEEDEKNAVKRKAANEGNQSEDEYTPQQATVKKQSTLASSFSNNPTTSAHANRKKSTVDKTNSDDMSLPGKMRVLRARKENIDPVDDVNSDDEQRTNKKRKRAIEDSDVKVEETPTKKQAAVKFKLEAANPIKKPTTRKK
jgi:hypothetical protein